MERNTINNMKKALLIVCLFISVIASGQNNFFWSHNSSGGYGLLYNWPTVVSADNITSSNDWIVPSETAIITLRTYLDPVGSEPSNVAGNKLKEAGFLHWNLSTSATNDYGFRAVGAGIRTLSNFTSIKEQMYIWTTTSSVIAPTTAVYGQLPSNSSSFRTANGTIDKRVGISIRLLYVGAGTPTQYVGNNGFIYKVVQIGTQYWTASNLRETKWRNGIDIANITDQSTWSALTTPAWCVYDNNFKYR